MTMSALFSPPRPVAIPRQFPAIVGLDLSMTATGLAVSFPALAHEGGTRETALILVKSRPIQSGRNAKGKPDATWEDRRVRMADIVRRITEAVPDGSLVFLEAPSYASSGSGTFDRSGLWWWTFSELVALECRVVPVSPAQRMMYATGKGGGADAGKDAVIAAVTRRYPDLDVRDNNVADAVVLMAMARRAAGAPMEAALPATHLRALDKLEAI
jgi:hypothetical protein